MQSGNAERHWGTYTTIGLCCVFLAVGIWAGLVYSGAQQVANQVCIKKYSLTSKSLDCAEYESSSASIKALDIKLDQSVNLFTQSGKVTRMSVWVRDLESKQWASTNENDKFAPASLLKLPLMVAYYKVAEIQPTLLDTQIVYEKPSTIINNGTQDYKPEDPLVPGTSYTVEQLIEHMVIDSDNDAAALLSNHMDQSIFDNTMVDLGIKIPGDTKDYDFVTAKSYANIFRILYNASYLSRDYSEKALELMSKEKFGGIASVIPQGVAVAHKFGERELDASDGTVLKRELHDCGIVYKGDHPYSLCVMTEGANFDTLLSVIKDVSTLVYTSL